MQGLDEHDVVLLQPNRGSDRVVFACLGAAVGAVALMTLLLIATGWVGKEVNSAGLLALILSIGGAILGARRLVAGPLLRLRLDGELLVLEDERGRKLGEIDPQHNDVERGYFVVRARGYRGHIPALRLALAEGKRLVVAVRDDRMAHYWRGDDPWERRFEHGVELPQATHFADGVDWQRVVITLGMGGELSSTPIQGA